MVPASIETVVIQSTPFCNIDCSYCYLPDRQSKGALKLEDLETALTNLNAQCQVNDKLNIVWHSGEPLILPVTYYQSALEIIRRIFSNSSIRFDFQTNGMLISEDWARLLSADDVNVCVSIDGPKHIHDQRRVTRNGGGTFDKTMHGINLLRDNSVEFSTICVLDFDYLDAPEEYTTFFEDHGVPSVSFNYPEAEGINTKKLKLSEELKDKHRVFWKHIYERHFSRCGKVFYFQIDRITRALLKRSKSPPTLLEHNPMGIVTIQRNGDFPTFSPELQGFSSNEFGEFNVGTLLPAFFLDEARLERIANSIDLGRERCRAECKYFEVCGGGHPSTKFFESGSFETSTHNSCVVGVQWLANVISEEIIRKSLDFKLKHKDVASF